LKPVIVFTTVGAGFDAAPLATALVDARLAACVNIIPAVRSIYRWQEKIEDEGEQLLLIKTVDDRVEALREALFARHPYEVPEFVVIAADDVSNAYGKWLCGSVA
jgi:periplasmic divalent cation tolerance protein